MFLFARNDFYLHFNVPFYCAGFNVFIFNVQWCDDDDDAGGMKLVQICTFYEWIARRKEQKKIQQRMRRKINAKES